MSLLLSRRLLARNLARCVVLLRAHYQRANQAPARPLQDPEPKISRLRSKSIVASLHW
jgi:hypothetical protein